jgi:predicted ribosomally synthesized peptide with nif11-like leader
MSCSALAAPGKVDARQTQLFSKGRAPMSSESFKNFLAKVQQDEGLRKELRATSGEAGMPVEALAAFAAGKGYEFKVEDVSSVLTDQQLDSVTGGLFNPTNGLPSTVVKIEGLNVYLSSAGTLMWKW